MQREGGNGIKIDVTVRLLQRCFWIWRGVATRFRRGERHGIEIDITVRLLQRYFWLWRRLDEGVLQRVGGKGIDVTVDCCNGVSGYGGRKWRTET